MRTLHWQSRTAVQQVELISPPLKSLSFVCKRKKKGDRDAAVTLELYAEVYIMMGGGDELPLYKQSRAQHHHH